MPAERHNQKLKEGTLEMSKLSRALGAAMLCLGLLISASVILAGQDQSMQKKEKDTVTITGTVSNVTDSAITIVDSQKTEHTVTVNSDTKVTKAGKAAALADVKASDVVTVQAKKAGDSWTAVSISVS
jgi:hypothetical protein